MGSDPEDLWAVLDELSVNEPAPATPGLSDEVDQGGEYREEPRVGGDPLVAASPEVGPPPVPPIDLEAAPVVGALGPDVIQPLPARQTAAVEPTAAGCVPSRTGRQSVRSLTAAGAIAGAALLLVGVAFPLKKEAPDVRPTRVVVEPTTEAVVRSPMEPKPSATTPAPALVAQVNQVVATQESATEPVVREAEPPPPVSDTAVPVATAEPKPLRRARPTPAQAESSQPPSPQWQDDAMDALDQLERQL